MAKLHCHLFHLKYMYEYFTQIVKDLVQRLEILERSSGGQDDFTNPTLLNSWEDFDTGVYNQVGYYRSTDGLVRLTGYIKDGTIGQVVFTLPVGYRPLKKVVIPTISNDAIGRVDIEPDGDVIVTSGNNTYVALDGISFRAMQ